MIHKRSGMVRLPAYLQRRSAGRAPMPIRNLDETEEERGEVAGFGRTEDRSSHAHTELSDRNCVICL